MVSKHKIMVTWALQSILTCTVSLALTNFSARAAVFAARMWRCVSALDVKAYDIDVSYIFLWHGTGHLHFSSSPVSVKFSTSRNNEYCYSSVLDNCEWYILVNRGMHGGKIPNELIKCCNCCFDAYIHSCAFIVKKISKIILHSRIRSRLN